jgi:hypothetical protein
MSGNLKNRLRSESSIGTVNTDLSRTTPPADPRFMPEKDEPLEDQMPALVVRQSGSSMEITVPHQRLPDLPIPKNPLLFTATPRKRT